MAKTARVKATVHRTEKAAAKEAGEFKSQAEEEQERKEAEAKAKKARAKLHGEVKRFRLLTHGTHEEPVEGTGDLSNEKHPKPPDVMRYAKGDIIESVHELDEIFPNKFELLADETREAKALKAKKEAAEEEEEDSKGNQVVKGKRAQDTFEPGTKLRRNPADHNIDPKNRTSLRDKVSDLGNNVTEEFPNALEADLAVFEKGKKYTITERDDTTKPIDGDASGLSKSEVNGYLRKFLRADLDEVDEEEEEE